MNCTEVEKLVSEYLENSLTGDLRKDIDEHLRICPACRKRADDISWVMQRCADFPVIDPPRRLQRAIFETTASSDARRRVLSIIFDPRSYRRLSLAHALAFTMMAFLVIGAITNFPVIVKNLNRFTHQAYSTGLKYYYSTGKVKEEISTIREDFPSTLDKGIAKSIGWIKNKLKKEEKKNGEKKEKVETERNNYFISA